MLLSPTHIGPVARVIVANAAAATLRSGVVVKAPVLLPPAHVAPVTRAVASKLMTTLCNARPVKALTAFTRRSPYLASGITSAFFLGGTDLLTQKMVPKKSQEADVAVDWRRTLSMFSWGLLWYGGPQQCLWMVVYPRLIGQGTMLQAAAKVFADCFVNMSTLYIPTFYMWTGFVKGMTPAQSYELLKKDYLNALFGMSFFWIPVQGFNFRCVPLHLQTYTVNVANVFNKGWLSWYSNRAGPAAAAAEEEAVSVSLTITLPETSHFKDLVPIATKPIESTLEQLFETFPALALA